MQLTLGLIVIPRKNELRKILIYLHMESFCRKKACNADSIDFFFNIRTYNYKHFVKRCRVVFYFCTAIHLGQN